MKNLETARVQSSPAGQIAVILRLYFRGRRSSARPPRARSWHQKTERVEAHILVCFLAFVLWTTLEQTAKTAGRKTIVRGNVTERSRSHT